MAKDEGKWPSISFESRPWRRDDDPTVSRNQLRTARGPYESSVPPAISALNFNLPPELQALTEEATSELARFDAEVGPIAAPFGSILLRSESASSSEIENLTSGSKQIALAALGEASSSNAKLIVANANAMNAAIDLSSNLDSAAVIEMHRALLEQKSPEMVGHWRDEQVWIGGGGISPHSAVFVPPHHERVPGLMTDVLEFARRTDLPLLAQTSIAHAQFETIHPFPDGNGRTGRALIQAMLRAGRVTRSVTVPVSAGLLHDVERYFQALESYRSGDIAPIVTAVADASFAAVDNGRKLVSDIELIRARWAESVRARADSSVHRLRGYLLEQPIVNASIVSKTFGVSTVAAQQSIDRLESSGILTQFSAGRRNRLWQAREVIDALDRFAERAKRRR